MKDDSSLTRYIETALAQSITSMTGREYRVAPDAAAVAMEKTIIWQQVFSVLDAPCLWIVAGRDLWEAMSRITLEAAGIEDVAEEDCRSTWQEILSQTVAGVASAMTVDHGQEVTCSRGAAVDTEPAGVAWHEFSLTDSIGKSWSFKAAWTKELAGWDPASAKEMATPPARDCSVSKTFDLLLEVALPVAVSFGRTSLQIREVLKLNTGSIVELDRFVTDPVEVIVNNCVIARGEVVVVDGNDGVRIHQLASREERLRSGMTEAAHRSVKV